MWHLTFRRFFYASLLFAAWVQAATITVTTTNDTSANDGQCSLREAISAANNQSSSGDAQGECVAGDDGLNTIVLPEGTFNLGSSLSVSSDIRINGAGMNETLIDGGNSVRVLYLSSGNHLTLNGIRVIGGSSGGSGGGLYMETGSFARIEYSRFSANTATNNGGAIYVDDEGFLDIIGSTFSNNTASNGGAIYSDYGVVTIENSTLTANTASSDGGAAYIYTGNISIRNSDLTNNTANYAGGLYV